MLVGHILLAKTESCPAPLAIGFVRLGAFDPKTEAAESETQFMQSSWNSTASETLSVWILTVHGCPCVPPWLRPPISAPEAISANESLISSSMACTVSSAGARISRLNLTLPGTVFVEPGVRVNIPVEAKAFILVAARCECRIIFEAASIGSLRAENGVVPVCVSRPVTSTVYHLYA